MSVVREELGWRRGLSKIETMQLKKKKEKVFQYDCVFAGVHCWKPVKLAGIKSNLQRQIRARPGAASQVLI